MSSQLKNETRPEKDPSVLLIRFGSASFCASILATCVFQSDNQDNLPVVVIAAVMCGLGTILLEGIMRTVLATRAQQRAVTEFRNQ
jgi:hypothetical protein